MLGRTEGSHRRWCVHTRLHPELHVRRMESAEGLAEESPDVKRQHNRSGSLEQGVRAGNHQGRCDNVVGNSKWEVPTTPGLACGTLAGMARTAPAVGLA